MPTITFSPKPDKFYIQAGSFFPCHFSSGNVPFQTILLFVYQFIMLLFLSRNSRLSPIIFKVSTCCYCKENCLNLWSAAENFRADADLFSVFYSKKAELFHVNRLPSKRSICNVTPYLSRYLHWKIKKKIWKCRLLNVLSASSIKGGLKEYGYISFVMGGRNGQAERYLHFSDRGLGGFSWWLDQG